MKIYLMRALTPRCMEEETCWMCEANFTPRVVVIFGGPDAAEMCEECFKACDLRRETLPTGVVAGWPTWATYTGLLDDFESLAYITSSESRKTHQTAPASIEIVGAFSELSYFLPRISLVSDCSQTKYLRPSRHPSRMRNPRPSACSPGRRQYFRRTSHLSARIPPDPGRRLYKNNVFHTETAGCR